MQWTRRSVLQQGAMMAAVQALGGRSALAAPEAEWQVAEQKEEKVLAATDVAGPFAPDWVSLRDHYEPPAWLQEHRLGIFIHWGLYSIPAHGNEWYARHMYTSDVAWHTEHYGPPDKFGYKDFIPLFTAKRFEPAEWAGLFKAAGAGFVVPVAEHHDGFAMWDSALTPWCAGKMGPKRDLIGDLAKAVRAQNLIFGCSFHRMEHHTFMYPKAGVANDQFDPRYAQFYGPPQPGEMNDGLASAAFQQDWLARARELVTRYEPQLMYFDNGVNAREYDAVKLEFAALYYNHAAQWGRQATIVSKDRAYLAGSVPTFEKATRAPKWMYPYPFLSDDAISGQSWGYVEGMRYRSAAELLTEMVELVCKGGGLLLNVSPMGDGSIPEGQQVVLRQMGTWLAANGAALNGTRPWRVYGEGPGVPAAVPNDWAGGSSADQKGYLPARRIAAPTAADFRFTTSNGRLHVLGWRRAPGQTEARVVSLRQGEAKVDAVTLTAEGRPLRFQQTAEALVVELPPQDAPDSLPYALDVQGSTGLG